MVYSFLIRTVIQEKDIFIEKKIVSFYTPFELCSESMRLQVEFTEKKQI